MYHSASCLLLAAFSMQTLSTCTSILIINSNEACIVYLYFIINYYDIASLDCCAKNCYNTAMLYIIGIPLYMQYNWSSSCVV